MLYSHFRVEVEKKSPIAFILTRSTIYNGVFSTLSMFYKLYKFKAFTFSTVDGEKKKIRERYMSFRGTGSKRDS